MSRWNLNQIFRNGWNLEGIMRMTALTRGEGFGRNTVAQGDLETSQLPYVCNSRQSGGNDGFFSRGGI